MDKERQVSPSAIYTFIESPTIVSVGKPQSFTVHFPSTVGLFTPLGSGTIDTPKTSQRPFFALLSSFDEIYAFEDDGTGWKYGKILPQVNVTDTVGVNPDPTAPRGGSSGGGGSVSGGSSSGSSSSSTGRLWALLWGLLFSEGLRICLSPGTGRTRLILKQQGFRLRASPGQDAMADLIITTPGSHRDNSISLNSMLHRHLTFRWRPSHRCYSNRTSSSTRRIKSKCRPCSSPATPAPPFLSPRPMTENQRSPTPQERLSHPGNQHPLFRQLVHTAVQMQHPPVPVLRLSPLQFPVVFHTHL